MGIIDVFGINLLILDIVLWITQYVYLSKKLKRNRDQVIASQEFVRSTRKSFLVFSSVLLCNIASLYLMYYVFFDSVYKIQISIYTSLFITIFSLILINKRFFLQDK